MTRTESNRPYKKVLDRLRAAGLRPTRQRLALAKLLFEGGDRHVTAGFELPVGLETNPAAEVVHH